MAETALLIVDVQNDFCPGGSLPVPDGDKVVEPLNIMIERAVNEEWLVIASRDWHPRESRHFVEFRGQWPVHCVRDTAGAAFHLELQLPEDAIIISKGLRAEGESADVDGYSAFDGIDLFRSRPFSKVLAIHGVQLLYVGGLATDYCVKATVLDACRHGFKVRVLDNACRGVDINEGDSRRAIMEMMGAGAEISSEPYGSMVMRIPRFQRKGVM